MQLVAYGAQDIYLTGNPQITFFKVVYRRHTNFSMELIEQTFNGSVSGGSRVTSTISRNGDLVHRLYTNYDPAACATVTGDGKVASNYLSYALGHDFHTCYMAFQATGINSNLTTSDFSYKKSIYFK